MQAWHAPAIAGLSHHDLIARSDKLLPERAALCLEQGIRIGPEQAPAAARQFGVQLAGSPAGMTKVEPQRGRFTVIEQRLQYRPIGADVDIVQHHNGIGRGG